MNRANAQFAALTEQEISMIETLYRAFDDKNPDLLNDVLTPDWKDVPMIPGQADGPQGLKDQLPMFFSAFPDLKVVVHEIVGASGHAGVRASITGTHQGEIFGVAPTGQFLDVPIYEFHHLENGKITHTWHLEDWFGMLNRVGAWPPAPAGKPAPALKPVAAPDPLVDARFPCEIAPDVWIIPDRRISLVPNIGIIVGKKKALVVDSGLGPESGRQVLDAARRLAPGRELVLTYTHAHPEHAFGAVALKNHAEVFLNRPQNDYLTQSGPAILTYLRSFGPSVAHSLEGAEIVPATTTYSGDRASLDLGGRRVEFRNWGTAHSPGDQTIFLPQENILFAGDLIEERMTPIVPYLPPHSTRADISTVQWTKALQSIEQSRPAIIVPGHGSLGQAEEARVVREWLAAVQSRTTASVGESMAGKSVQLAAEIQALHPDWEFPERIEWAVNYFMAS